MCGCSRSVSYVTTRVGGLFDGVSADLVTQALRTGRTVCYTVVGVSGVLVDVSVCRPTRMYTGCLSDNVSAGRTM